LTHVFQARFDDFEVFVSCQRVLAGEGDAMSGTMELDQIRDVLS